MTEVPMEDYLNLKVKVSRMESVLQFLADRCNNLDDKVEGRAGEQFSAAMKKFDVSCFAVDLKMEQQVGHLSERVSEQLRKLGFMSNELHNFQNRLVRVEETLEEVPITETFRYKLVKVFEDDDDY